MLKPFSKIQSLTLALLLTIMTTITAAYALPPFKAKSNLPAVSAPVANPFANLQLNYNTNTGNTQTGGQSSGGKVEGTQKFPIVIGDDTTPDTVPNRPCILMPPEYYNSIDPWDRWMIPVTWYEDVFNTFSGYLIDAEDTDNDGNYNSVADFLADALTHALPVNSFNNFCFKGGPTNHSGPPGQDWNPYVDDDGDGEYNEDPPGYGDEDGDGDTNEDGWPSQGFDSYPTLDLYVGNENSDFGTDSLDNDYFVVDERKFLVATKCDDPNNSTADVNEAYSANDVTCDGQFSSLTSYYALEDEMDVEIGDIVRFGVYVHNNSLYPDNPAAVADDVLLQFDTKTNPNNPRAAISSPDNVYHENPYDTGSTTLRDVFDLDNDGSTTEILRMATDTSRVNSTVPIELTPIEGATWLYNGPVAESAPNADSAYHVPFRITNGSTTTIQDYGTPPATPLTITFNPSINQEDHELLIDQIPGCFEFAGWYFFDYQVAAGEESLCTELDVQWMQQWPTYEALPVIEDEFIPPADGDPPIPIGYSDATDEGLYIVGETNVPLIVQVNRNGYDGDLIWELLLTDIAGNINPYQPTTGHFCSNAAMGIQQNNCNSGTTLSENNSGIIFNRFISNPTSTFGTAYQQDTYKVYNLNRNVVLHIYAPPPGGDKKSACTEAVFMPQCTDMTLVTPSTLEDFLLDLSTGMEIEVDTVPDYYNGPIIFGTSNLCGVFDIDNLGGNFSNDPEPALNLATSQYEVQVDFGVNDPKVAWYNIDTTEPGCSVETGDGDLITINSLSDKGARCAEDFTVTTEPVPQCTDVTIDVPTGDIYLDDGTPTIDAEIIVNAEPGWSGTVQVWICEDTSSLINCLLSIDSGALINGAPQPFLTTAQNGDIIPITVSNISVPPEKFIYVNTIGTLICNADQGVEWCGDGLVNDGEECDPADPLTPDCTATCELPEVPGACTEIDVDVTPDVYLDDADGSMDVTIDTASDPSWVGQTHVMVCPPAMAGNFGLCFAFRDQGIIITNESIIPPGAALTVTPGRLEINPVTNGDLISFTVDNIADPTDVLAVFNFPAMGQCNENVPFEYCGDSVVNDGEECDPADPLTPDCTATCELPELPGSCTDLELTTVPVPVYIDDTGSSFDMTIDITGEATWPGGELILLVCADATDLSSCQSTLDGTAEITVGSSPAGSVITGDGTNEVSVDPVIDGDQVTANVTNIDDPANTIAAFVIDEELCADSSEFEYCGDSVVNNGEECDFADPLTPECTASCELPEGPFECTEIELSTVPTPVYLEDFSTAFDTTIDVIADPAWPGGEMEIMVCGTPFTQTSCQSSLDSTAEITITGSPAGSTVAGDGSNDVTIDPVQSGDQVTTEVTNISDTANVVAAFITDEPFCEDSANFEYCGDAIVNDGEACDVNDPSTPECTSSCEFPEEPEVSCNEVGLTVEPTYLEAGTIVDGAITVSADIGWSGNLIIYVCGNPTSPVSCLSTLDPLAEINGNPNTPSGVNLGTVQNGDMVIFEVENISNPNMSIAAFTAGIGTNCSEDINFSFCGDGTEDAGETCDDGNNLDDDGCSATCEDEIVIPELCGDGILDPDGIDNVPNNADDIPENDDDEACDDGLNNGNGPSECRIDCSLPICGDGIQDLTEDCDDGALNGTEDSECTVSCEIEEEDDGGPPGDGDSATCTDLEITSASNISSIPAFIVIETNPSYWGETNIATFDYSSNNPSGIFSSNDGIGAGGFWNTNDKSVLYTGNPTDTITVSDSVQAFGGCRDEVTLSETPLPPDEPTEPTEPGEPGEPGGPGDDGGGPGDGGPDSGGGGCPGIDIITPSPKILTASEGYIEIVSPRAAIYDTGTPESLGEYRYHTVGGNVKFVDTETLTGATAIYKYLTIGTPIPNSVWSTDLTTESKEVFYFNADISLDITVIVTDVTDTAYTIPSCGDTIQNSFTAITGPRIEKFGWIHETGGNTTDDTAREVNYQISYWNSLTNTDDPSSYPTEVTIQDSINSISIGGHPGIYAVLDDDSLNTTDYVLYDYEDLSRPENFTTNFVDRDLHDSNGNVVIRYYANKPSVHWLQEGNFNTWGGDDAQIPNCDETLATYVAPLPEDGEPLPPPPTYGGEGLLCFTGRIDTTDGITVNNMEADTVFELEYEGHIYTTNFCNDVTNTSFTESFPNSATGTYTVNSTEETISDSETLYATCNYLLTRNAGDVLFYTDSDPGANLAALTEDQTRNSDGLVFINTVIEGLSTFFGSGVSGSVTPSKCDNPDANNILPNMLSSFICQVYYDPYNTNDEWKPSKINQKTDFNFLEGYDFDNSTLPLNDLTDSTLSVATQQTFSPLDSQNTRAKIYKFDGNVRIGTASSSPATLTLEGGARTIIVNGDLTINSNILYPNDTSSPDHELSSIAFIVTGNIKINSNVQNLAGVYVSRGGEFQNLGSTTSSKQLVFHGSVFGNLQPLIADRLFIGAPILDGGNIVIRYDNRALRNTPPGLKDAIDLQWLRVAR